MFNIGESQSYISLIADSAVCSPLHTGTQHPWHLPLKHTITDTKPRMLPIMLIMHVQGFTKQTLHHHRLAPTRKRAGLKGLRSTVDALPLTISSARALPVAGALRIPQQV